MAANVSRADVVGHSIRHTVTELVIHGTTECLDACVTGCGDGGFPCVASIVGIDLETTQNACRFKGRARSDHEMMMEP